MMLAGGGARACYVRSFSITKGNHPFAAVARPRHRLSGTVITRRPWRPSTWTPKPMAPRWFRSVDSSGHWGPAGGIARGKVDGNRKGPSSRKVAAILAAIAAFAGWERWGDATEDDPIPSGAIQAPRVSRMTRRRDTSVQIRWGGSLLLDRAEPPSSTTVAGANDEDIRLLLPEDEDTISPFLKYLMMQLELVRIHEDDQCLYNLPIGLPGLGCKHCRCSRNRTQTRCRIFPMNRRTFPALVRKDLYNHVRRCERCPPEVKLELQRLKRLETGTKISREERVFFKKLWFRMGHKAEI